jgi:hypothetical protein
LLDRPALAFSGALIFLSLLQNFSPFSFCSVVSFSVGETSLDEALLLAVKVLSKTMDTTSPSVDKVEIATVTRVNGQVKYKVLEKNELEALLKRAEVILKAEAAKESAADI